MRVRELRSEDIPKLQELFRKKYPEWIFPDLTGPLIECVHVVVDEDDNPICAGVAERSLEGHFVAGDIGSPHAGLYALRLLHASMSAALKTKGYDIFNAHIPESIAERFGRILTRRLGWYRNFPSFGKRL